MTDAAANLPSGATAHRRDDGEVVGWILPDADSWRAIDVLGRDVISGAEWLDAEEALEQRGLAFLADPWVLEREGADPLRVRMVEVTPMRIVVKVDDFGDVNHATQQFVLAWPIPPQLRAPKPGDPDGFTLFR